MSDELEQLEATPSTTDEALDVGVIDALAEMVGDDEPTLDDLRALPGAEGYSDEELQALWDKTKTGGDEKEEVVETPAQPAAPKRPWKYYGADGKEIADIDKMTVADFLKGKLGYTANSKEQTKALDELIRVAQYGHLNESKLSRAEQGRQAAIKELTGLREANTKHVQNEKLINYAFQQFLQGNDKPLQAIINKIQEQAAMPPEFAKHETPQTDYEAEQQGMRVWYEEIQPRADEVATRYGAKAAEVRQYVQYLIGQEENLTQDRLEEILSFEMPMVLEQAGYVQKTEAAASATISQKPDETAVLKAKVAELETQLKNASTAEVRKRNKTLPPSSGRDNGESSMGEVPAEVMKDPAKFKKWLRDG